MKQNIFYGEIKATESSGHFTWMNSYSGQDFCNVLFCGILCLLLYSACGTGYSVFVNVDF